MKHTYKITGMTCDNCKEKITKGLGAISGIIRVEIDREKELAEISMSEHVQTPVMQEALTFLGSYTISMDMSTSMKQKQNNHFKDLLPLFVIVGAILVFSILITFFMNQDFTFGMRMFTRFVSTISTVPSFIS